MTGKIVKNEVAYAAWWLLIGKTKMLVIINETTDHSEPKHHPISGISTSPLHSEPKHHPTSGISISPLSPPQSTNWRHSVGREILRISTFFIKSSRTCHESCHHAIVPSSMRTHRWPYFMENAAHILNNETEK